MESGRREAAARRGAHRVHRLIVDRFREAVRSAEKQALLEPFAESCLQGMVMRAAPRIDIGDDTKLLVDSELTGKRLLLDAAHEVAGGILRKIGTRRRRIDESCIYDVRRDKGN